MPTYRRNDPFLDVARGRIPGLSIVHVLGRARNVGSSSVTLWEESSLKPQFPGPSRVSIASDNAGDDAATGQGLHTVGLVYLTTSLDQAFEVVSLDGTSSVLTTATMQAIIQFFGLTAGSSLANVGKVTAQVSAQIMESMPVGFARDMSAIHYTARSLQAYISRMEFTITNPGGQVQSLEVEALFRRPFTNGPDQIVHQFILSGDFQYFIPFERGPQIPSNTLLELRARRIEGTQNVDVNCSFDLVLVDESLYNG